jgi:hypothetical protein
MQCKTLGQKVEIAPKRQIRADFDMTVHFFICEPAAWTFSQLL